MLRALVGNWELKILSVILAAGLWVFVGSAQRSEIALAVPVEYVGLEGPMALDGPQRDTVEVQVRATRWSAARVTPCVSSSRTQRSASVNTLPGVSHPSSSQIDTAS